MRDSRFLIFAGSATLALTGALAWVASAADNPPPRTITSADLQTACDMQFHTDTSGVSRSRDYVSGAQERSFDCQFKLINSPDR